ncbi:hypothetical protein CVU37_04875 [candidate division BRC1 bacterium HGW-BRC1-1]|jgi:hypothetical protein|nr:MAG: hypothetical protein CVU37_04875 [candidate division BRC1 bacterium HGW-BRC1-1]
MIDSSSSRVLAIRPFCRGFGFVLLEGPRFLLDWGVREAARTGKNCICRSKIDILIQHYQPDCLLVEDTTATGCRRCPRVRHLLRSTISSARRKQLRVATLSLAQVKAAFASEQAITRHDRARVIARYLPELLGRMPPKRKPWMSDDSRLSIFDAAALALTFYTHEQRRRVRSPRAQ